MVFSATNRKIGLLLGAQLETQTLRRLPAREELLNTWAALKSFKLVLTFKEQGLFTHIYIFAMEGISRKSLLLEREIRHLKTINLSSARRNFLCALWNPL